MCLTNIAYLINRANYEDSSLHDIQFSYALRIVYKHKQLSQNREYYSAGCESGIGAGLVTMPDNMVTTDTIRCYRNCLTIAELKDTAGIAMRTVRKDGRWETRLVAEANCGFATTFMMSDQKASGSFLFAGLLWLLCSLWYIKRKRPELIAQGISYGGIVFYNDKFMTLSGEQIRLTPMQHSLLEMFITSDTHTLSKQHICDRLWPKKPDASDTLYTLIKRIKPIIETHSTLKIQSDRGKSYSLIIK